MSAQRTVPASRPAVKLALIVALVAGAAALAYSAGKRHGAVHEVLSASPADAQRVAVVRQERCADGWCETIWIGPTRESLSRVASLAAGSDHCEVIAWARDGFRVGFIVNGYQLRIFDGVTGKQVGQVNLLEPDGIPSSRLARGVTFSQNGAAVTFDDCPRGHSGCKSGLVAVR